MRQVWITREIEAPADVLWRLLVSPDDWPRWAPTVRRAKVVGDRLVPGATGTVTTIVGIRPPFTVTDLDPGRRWTWKVAGIQATDHTVDALGAGRCRVGFGVPWPAAPYLAVCALALRRLDRLATTRTLG